MRKHLCRTVAFVALGLTTGLVATQANAESGLKLGITGFYRGAAGAVVGGSASPDPGSPIASTAGFGDFGRSSSGFRQEIRIDFTGQTTLDNGLTVGLLVGLDGRISPPSAARRPRRGRPGSISKAGSAICASARRPRR
jgi:hypothetical protein